MCTRGPVGKIAAHTGLSLSPAVELVRCRRDLPHLFHISATRSSDSPASAAEAAALILFTAQLLGHVQKVAGLDVEMVGCLVVGKIIPVHVGSTITGNTGADHIEAVRRYHQ
jgi:hypothetical protein